MTPVVNVLTRTSRRPVFFSHNRASVLNQDYPTVKQIVSYDDEETMEYLSLYEGLECHSVDRVPRMSSGHFPYNHYLNSLYSHVEEGWIMFLDDDDIFLDAGAVSLIMSHIKSDDDLVMWKVRFPNNRIVPKRIGMKPYLGNVSAIGFMFHSKHIPTALWDDRKGGDYRLIKKLYGILTPRWVDHVLTGVNYETNRNCGSGNRNDRVA